MSERLTVAGLFAGVGGIEQGLNRAGHDTVLLSEVDSAANAVLEATLSGVELNRDVRSLRALPAVDLCVAGFPCTDLSQAGRKVGIAGEHSSLVNEVFRLLDSGSAPDSVLLENVSYMLRLDQGRGMWHLVEAFESRGYTWAYRVVDARAFGVPQRRQRVLMLASKTYDPRSVLFADDSGLPAFADVIGPVDNDHAYGFYWTEGLRGLGWTHNAVPTIKGGSGLGIPSAPAIWMPGPRVVGTPTIQDCERMQGFPADWTLPAVTAGHKVGVRWRLVGNAVCVPMAEWVGARLAEPGDSRASLLELAGPRWPSAAFGHRGHRFAADIGLRPFGAVPDLAGFLRRPLTPLSRRATAGFLSRARRSRLRFADGFLQALDKHLDNAAA